MLPGVTDSAHNIGVSMLAAALEDIPSTAGAAGAAGAGKGEEEAMQTQIGECLERMCAEMAGHADTIQSLTSEMLRNVLAQSQQHDASQSAEPSQEAAHNAPVLPSLQPPEVLSETLVREHLGLKNDEDELDRRRSTGDMGDGCGGIPILRYNNHGANITGKSTTLSRSNTDGSTCSGEKLTELQLIQIANLQLAALKAVTVLLGSSRYLELLLVPKVRLTEKKGSHLGGATLQTVVVDPTANELRESMRTIMKEMVRKAVLPSPMKRTALLVDLERAQSMLHKVALMSQAEEGSGLVEKRGGCLTL